MEERRDYTELVNVRRVRGTIRRSFQGFVVEAIAELLQNSQRAGARAARVEATGSCFAFHDDGHGVAGLDGFHDLLRIAETRYERPEVDEQDPMGVGLNSLLAHPYVSEVTFASGGLAVTIDTARWWDDPSYFETWANRAAEVAEPVAGLRVEARVREEFVVAACAVLTGRAVEHEPAWNPAAGYEGILEVTLNGAPVDTRPPHDLRHKAPLLVGSYQGCRLSVSLDDHACSGVLWYGQAIRLDSPRGRAFGPFSVVLDVRAGRPLTPLAPTRAGIVRDDAFHAYARAVKNLIFEFVFDPARRGSVKAREVVAVYSLDRERADAQAPLFVAAPYLVPNHIGSFEDVGGLGEAEVFSYEEPPLILEERVLVIADEEPEYTPVGGFFGMYGLEAFLPNLEAVAWKLEAGAAGRLRVGAVAWKPGPPLDDVFYEPGAWGLAFGAEPKEWRPVTGCVWTFDCSVHWNFGDTDWYVTAPDRMAFYEGAAWAAFDPEYDDATYDEIRDSYDQSLDVRVRRLIGPSVSHDFTLSDLAEFVPGDIVCVNLVRDEPGRSPHAVEVTSASGASVRLLLYG